MNTQVDYTPQTRIMWFRSTEPDADALLGTVVEKQPEDQSQINIRFDLERWTIRTVDVRNVYFH